MDETSLSLLLQLQQSDDSNVWNRLDAVYGPLIEKWIAKYGIQEADLDDLKQDVLMVMSREIRNFDHNGRKGAFRNWLRTILMHRLRNHWRSQGKHAESADRANMEDRLKQLEDPNSDLSKLWAKEHDQFVLTKLLESTQSEFSPQTWSAFRAVTLGGQRADQVAQELDISLNAVFIAKSRVLSRLRQKARGLVEAYSVF